MKNINKLLLLGIPAILILLVLWAYLTKPIHIEMKMLMVFENAKSMPISECPIYWTYLDDHEHGTLYFEQNIKDYLNSYDYSNGDLVISWGRPIHSLSYTKMDKLRASVPVIGHPIFGAVETLSTIYIYQVQNTNSFRLISEYDHTLVYPEIELVK